MSDDNQPSYEEDELSPLQKSQIIINTEPGDAPYNSTVINADFKVDDLFRYMVSARSLLREYEEKLFDDDAFEGANVRFPHDWILTEAEYEEAYQ